MSTTTNIPVNVATNVPVGKTTVGGVIFAVVAAVGAIYAAVEGNDVATATGGLVALLAAVKVLGGRYEQAVAQIQAVAPVITEVARGVAESKGAVVERGPLASPFREPLGEPEA